MEQVNFNYSMKNIPIPTKQDFLTQLISSSEKVVKNFKWKAYWFFNPTEPRNTKETFGFNSTKPAPFVPELKEFENKMYELVKDTKFKAHKSQFQQKLKEDTSKVKSDDMMYVAADKTTNYYKVDKDSYNDLLQKQITKDYKKTNMEAVDEVTKVDKEIVTELDIEDRVYSTTAKQAFITLKDHKPNFNNNPSCRLLNPTKTELGRITKQKLANFNAVIREKTKLNQWQNTKSVVDWFTKIENKQRCSFIQYDIDNFYASITETLIHKTLDWASNYVHISQEDRRIILHSKKTFLFDKNQPWCKKGQSNCDVGMGSFDGAGASTCSICSRT